MDDFPEVIPQEQAPVVSQENFFDPGSDFNNAQQKQHTEILAEVEPQKGAIILSNDDKYSAFSRDTEDDSPLRQEFAMLGYNFRSGYIKENGT